MNHGSRSLQWEVLPLLPVLGWRRCYCWIIFPEHTFEVTWASGGAPVMLWAFLSLQFVLVWAGQPPALGLTAVVGALRTLCP